MWTWNSDPFGTDAANPNPAGAGAFAYNLRFPGQVFDGQAGLHDNYFRDYDPAAGRYAESDPIGLRSGINTYPYVGGNPLSNVDPSGRFITSVDAACAMDPSFCAEIMGQIIRNNAAISGDGCSQEAANAMASALDTVASIAAILPALPAAKGLTTLARDATGKIHTPPGTSLPRENVKRWFWGRIRPIAPELCRKDRS
jgi:RHS repeat-associated protein